MASPRLPRRQWLRRPRQRKNSLIPDPKSGTLSKSSGQALRTRNQAKKRLLGGKMTLFGPKAGQNQGFAVTDSSIEQKCKLLIYCKLHEIKWSKKDFHRVGGWGADGFRGKKRGKWTWIARVADWTLVMGPRICDCSIVRRMREIICNTPAVGLTPSASSGQALGHSLRQAFARWFRPESRARLTRRWRYARS